MAGKKSSTRSSSSRASLPRQAKDNAKQKVARSSGSNDERPPKKPRQTGSDREPGKSGKPGQGKLSGSKESKEVLFTRRVTNAVTFGIEFEFVLAFHEKALDFMKKEGMILEIIKDSDYSKQKSLVRCEIKEKNGAYLGGQDLWPSWLVRVPSNDEAIANDAVRGTFQIEPDGNYVRRYSIEPLLVATQALASAGLDNVQVIGWMDRRHIRNHCRECQDPNNVSIDHYTTSFGNYGNHVLLRGMDPKYDKWTLTNDYTIVPVRRSVLGARLAERGLGESSAWDSYGLELITRIMRFDELEDSIQEVKQHLSALNKQELVDLMESVWSTAHVHIGFDAETKADLSYRFFQHVSFILLCYELLVTFCFPRRCSGAATHQAEERPTEREEASQIINDRAAVRDANDAVVRKLEEEYTGDDDVRSNYDDICEWLSASLEKAPEEITWQDIRDATFTEEDNLVQTMQHMQMPSDSRDYDGQRNRGYMVNWCNIYTIWTDIAGFKNFKPTLEFRQHPCTIDADEIKHWVLILQAVMVLARKMVLADMKYGSFEPLDQSRTFAEREASKYPNDGLPFGTVKAYVTQLLGLNNIEGLYWENRYEKFKNDRPM